MSLRQPTSTRRRAATHLRPRPTATELQALVKDLGSNVAAAHELGVSEWTIRSWRKQDSAQAAPDPPAGMRLLGIDIETRPNLGYVWDLWNQNISLSQLEETASMICFAAKWITDDGSGETRFWSEHADGRETMVRRAWELIDAADVVVHYNGRKFDVPHLQREFIQANLGPTSPFKQIDLLTVVKQNFRFPSNKLQFVAPALGLEDKESHEGFALWLSCMDGDKAAWDRMRDYNIQDVELLEQLYFRLRPWIKSHPSHGAFTGTDVCPTCGSADLESRGFAYLTTGRYQRYVCKCGRWSRSTKRLDGTAIAAVN